MVAVTTRTSMKKKKHYGHGTDVHGGAKIYDGPGTYTGLDSRRYQEKKDAGMISEDHNAIANMPQGVIMRAYPNAYGDNPFPQINDTISGVDRQMSQDKAGMKKFRSDTKH